MNTHTRRTPLKDDARLAMRTAQPVKKQMRFVKGKVSSPQTPNEAAWDRKYILSHGSDLGQNLSDSC